MIDAMVYGSLRCGRMRWQMIAKVTYISQSLPHDNPAIVGGR